MAGYSFVIEDGPDSGETFHLQAGITLVGRRDRPDPHDPEGSVRWTLTDPAVSRTHARIDWDGQGAPLLFHLSSTNATLLDDQVIENGESVGGYPLFDVSKVRMGQTTFAIIGSSGLEPSTESAASALSGEPAWSAGQTLSVGSASSAGQTLSVGSYQQWSIEQTWPNPEEYPMGETATEHLDGVRFDRRGHAVLATLEEPHGEAYIIRKLDDQLWTTSLFPGRSVPLQAGDTIRTERRKLILIGKPGD